MTLEELKKLRIKGKKPAETVALVPGRYGALADKDAIIVKSRDDDFRALANLDVEVQCVRGTDVWLFLVEKAYCNGAKNIWLTMIDSPISTRLVATGDEFIGLGDMSGANR